MLDPTQPGRPSGLLLALLAACERVRVEKPEDRFEQGEPVGFLERVVASCVVGKVAGRGGRQGEGEVVDRVWDRRGRGRGVEEGMSAWWGDGRGDAMVREEQLPTDGSNVQLRSAFEGLNPSLVDGHVLTSMSTCLSFPAPTTAHLWSCSIVQP